MYKLFNVGLPREKLDSLSYDVEYIVMGTGLIMILILASERISLDVRSVVVTITYTTVAALRELPLSKTKNGE
jgi:hypothetical protein